MSDKCGEFGCSYCDSDNYPQYTPNEYDKVVKQRDDYCRQLTAGIRAMRDVCLERDSAVECLRQIAAMKTVSKRQRINSEAAITWLMAHGYPLEAGGYVPGVGFKESI